MIRNVYPVASRCLALVACTVAAAAGAPERASGQEPPAGTVVVTNMDGRTAWLIDLPSGERRAEIPSRADPHEVALSSDGRTAVLTNYGAPGAGNLLQVVDVPSGTLVREVVVEGQERLHGAAFLDGDSLLALSSERTSELLIVGFEDGRVRRTLPTLGGAPHMLARGGRWLWAANITGGSLARVDPDGVAESTAWPAGERTEGIAATPDGTQGWTGSMTDGTVIGVDATAGEVVARIEGLGVPYRLAVTPDGGTVVVSDPERHELVLIDREQARIAARIDLAAAAAAAGLGGEPSPQGFTLSADGTWAFVSVKAIDRIAVVHLPTRTVTTFLDTGAGPDGIGFTRVRVGG